MFYVYFARSIKNKKVYVGCTSKEPDLRVKEHNSGSNKWTRLNGPFVLVYYETYKCIGDARLREKFYKTGIGKRIKNAIIKELTI